MEREWKERGWLKAGVIKEERGEEWYFCMYFYSSWQMICMTMNEYYINICIYSIHTKSPDDVFKMQIFQLLNCMQMIIW